MDRRRTIFNHNKPIKSVLTVQEKLSQDCPSLPPQAEVYMNLIDTDDLTQEGGGYQVFAER